jgi:AcrR family transcriptional regulator
MPTIESPPSRRERKKGATRDAIHDAALALTEEHGLTAVTVEAITELADVAPRTFFNHFPSKVNAVLGRDPGRAVRMGQAVVARPSDETPLVALRHVLLEDFLPRETDPEQILRRFRLVRREPLLLSTMHAEFEEAERAMTAAIATRTGLDPDTDLYPSLVVSVSVSAFRASIMRWCQSGGDLPLEPVVLQAFDQLAHGLVLTSTERTTL